MQDEFFNIKALLEIIFRITTISANRFADNYLHKDPAVIVKWKKGSMPSTVDLSTVAEFASKNSTENQKVQMRKEIKDLIVSSTLPAEFKKVILDQGDFKEFLLEALNTSVIRPSKPTSFNYQKQVACEILENIVCIDSRLYNLYEYRFYNDESLQTDLQQVEAFKEAVHNLPVKIDLKDRLTKLEKEKGLNYKYIQSFYDEITELSAQYNSFIEFLIAVACDNANREEILSCYIEFIKLSMNIIRSYTNITYINGLLALSNLGKFHKSYPTQLKSIPYLKAEEMSDKPELYQHCFSNYITEYSKLIDEKTTLLKKLKMIKK